MIGQEERLVLRLGTLQDRVQHFQCSEMDPAVVRWRFSARLVVIGDRSRRGVDVNVGITNTNEQKSKSRRRNEALHYLFYLS